MVVATGVTAMAVEAMMERVAAAKVAVERMGVASQIGIVVSNTSLMECASSTSSLVGARKQSVPNRV